MNTIDKIRAEIERRKKYQLEQFNKKKPDGRPNDGWAESLAIMGELEELLAFLDTLEEHVSEDLEEELENYYGRIPDDEDKINAARHFAEWQKAKMIEGATYNELMELYRAIRDELVKRHRDVPVNIKEKQ